MTFLGYAVAACAPALTLSTIRRFAVNVPYADDWWTLTWLFEALDGKRSFAEFVWRLHNEHWIPVIRLIIYVSARALSYNGIQLVLLGFAFRVVTLVLLWDMLRVTLPRPSPRLTSCLTAAFSWLLFSDAQFLNWIWYFPGIQWNLAGLAAVTLVWALTRWPGEWRGLWTALAAAVTGSFTVGAGLALWGVGLVGICVHAWGRGARLPWRKMSVWISVACTICGGYSLGFQKTPTHPNVWLFLSVPWQSALFFVTVLGGVFSGFSDPHPQVTLLLSVSGLVLLVLCVYWMAREAPASVRRAAPWLLLASFACLFAALATAGRVAMGLEQALMPHYVAISALFWVSFACVATIAFSANLDRTDGHLRLEQLLWVATIAGGLFYGYVGGFARGHVTLVAASRQLSEGQRYLLTYEDATDAELQALRPGVAGVSVLRAAARRLESARLGPFAGITGKGQRARNAPAAPTIQPPPYPVVDGVVWLDVAPAPPSPIRWVPVTLERQTEDALAVPPPSSLAWRLALPPGRAITFRSLAGIDPASWDQEPQSDGAVFAVIAATDDGQQERLWSRRLKPNRNRADRRWIPVETDLSRFGGRTLSLRLETGAGPKGDSNWDWAVWASPRVDVAPLVPHQSR